MIMAQFDSFDLCSMEKFGVESSVAPSTHTHEVHASESRVIGLQSMFKMHRQELQTSVTVN